VTEHSQLQQVHKATGEMVTSLRETSQTIVDSILILQESNLKLARSLLSTWFGSWMELLTPQTRSTPRLQPWEQPIQKQQEAFQRLTATSMQLYLDFLVAPFTLSHKLVEASMTEMQRERELVP
jgi:hypothetical protein